MVQNNIGYPTNITYEKQGDDNIFSYNGTYNENLVFNHRISGLYGEDKNSTIINSNSNYAIWLSEYADETCIEGFTIINSISRIPIDTI